MEINKQITLLPDEATELHKLKEKEKRKRWLRILLLLVGLLVAVCIAMGSAAFLFWNRHNGNPQVVWRYNAGGTIASAPVVADGAVYFGTLGEVKPAAFYAVDVVSGEELWHTSTSDSVFYWAPAVADNKLFFATEDGYFLALDAQTGHEQWRFGPEQREENLPDDAECHWCALKFLEPTVDNGRIYVASHDKYLYALDASSGAEQWRFHLGALAFYPSVVADGFVYVGDLEGDIHILDAASGTAQAHYQVGQEVWSVAVEGDRLYTAVDDQLVAMNRHTGAEQWRVQHSWSDRDKLTSLLHLEGELIYLMTMDKLTAVHKSDGSLAWQYNSFHGLIFSEPAIAEGLVVVGDTDSYLYVFEAATGKLLRRYYMVRHDPSSELSFMAEFVFDPAIVEGVIYFGWYDYLYAVATPDS